MVIAGQQKPAIRIDVDPAKLANMGLTLEDVRQMLVRATVNSPKGSLDGPARSFTVQANDQLTEPDAYAPLIVAYRNGAPVRLRDIGTATRGPQNREQIAWQNGTKGILLLIYKQPGANVIATVERIKAALPGLTPTCRRTYTCARSPTAHRTSAPPCTTCSSRCSVHRPGGHGDLPVPAQPVGDDHPRRDRAAGAARHVRDHVPARL